jgi:outer membrane protein assembly factor BamB
MDGDSGYGVAVDKKNMIYMTGSYIGKMTMGAENWSSGPQSDAFVAAFEPNGKFRWATHLGGEMGMAAGRTIAVDHSGHVVVGGEFSGTIRLAPNMDRTAQGASDGFVAEFAGSDGKLMWTESFSGQSAHALTTVRTVAIDQMDRVVCGGEFRDTLVTGKQTFSGHGGDDLYVIMLSAHKGTTMWARTFGNQTSEQFGGLALGGNGFIFVGGAKTGAIDLGMGHLPGLGASSDGFLMSLGGSFFHNM